MDINTADPGQTLVVYGAEPGSPSADGQRMLASWSAETTAETQL